MPAALFLITLALYPFFNLVLMSLSKVSAVNIVHGGWPFVGIANFFDVLHLSDFMLSFKNTLVFVAIVVSIGMIGGLGAATILQRPGRLSAVGLGLMVFIWAMPPVVLGSLWKFLLLPHGLVNEVLAGLHLTANGPLWLVQGNLVLVTVALVNSWAVIPFSAMVYRAALVDIPTDLLDAAAVDGASGWRTFLRIIVPLMMNGVATAASIVFILSWGEFLYAISILTDPSTYPISALISQQISAYGTSWSGLMALAVVGSLPILIVFVVAQRRLASGLSLGAVK
jgi:multiple sugar transport system permease protein